MHFGENQLSPSLLGLSPLTTGHPPCFQPWWVRPSTGSYPRFSLPMARSLGFGSTACDYNALFRLAFAPAPPRGLTSPQTVTRRLILQKARHHDNPLRRTGCDALTACKPTVSGTISLPSRGTFHLSLTVLVHYRSSVVLSLTRWSSRIPAGFPGSDGTREPQPGGVMRFAYGALTRSGATFQNASATQTLCNSGPHLALRDVRSHDPDAATPPGFTTTTV
jgi:hypothetical protein